LEEAAADLEVLAADHLEAVLAEAEASAVDLAEADSLAVVQAEAGNFFCFRFQVFLVSGFKLNNNDQSKNL
jgi:hypothetical protein